MIIIWQEGCKWWGPTACDEKDTTKVIKNLSQDLLLGTDLWDLGITNNKDI